MKLEKGVTYKVTHHYCPDCQAFVTCLGNVSHMSNYNTHEQYYRNTRDLERVFEKNGFKLEPVEI